MATLPIRGSCLCGRVRFELSAPPLFIACCHCSRCRRFTGSAHAANLFVRPADLEWLRGEDGLGGYVLEGEPRFPTAFCARCGSSMPSMSSTGRFWVVPAGGVDADPGVRPQRSIFWGSRACWYEDASALPRHEAMPPG